MRFGRLLAILVVVGGCGDGPAPAVTSDAGPLPVVDGGPAHDARARDAQLDDDAAAPDAGVIDAGMPDAGFVGAAMLSETGLYADIATRTLAAGVTEYAVRYELWSDGAAKRRFVFVPAAGIIDTSDPDRWRFPVGTRAWKEFHRDGVLVETRLLEKHAGGWTRVAYVWLDDESDAVAVPEGRSDARGTDHDVPAIDDCIDCHRGAVDDLLGVSALQLAQPEGPDLLERLAAEGRLSHALPVEPEVPGDDVERQALGYMHANCGHCHNEDHPLAAHRALRLFVPVGALAPEDTPAYRTALGSRASHTIEGTSINVVAGFPDRSQLYVRMHLRDERAMPPVGTELEDLAGAAAIRAWILAL
jgi:hypothetical protein